MPSGVYKRTIELKGITKNCVICDKSIYVCPSKAETKKLCSNKCRKLYLVGFKHKPRMRDGKIVVFNRKTYMKDYLRKYAKTYAFRAYRLRKRKAGILTKETIQQVYEDNIKRHGTLTCYLCLKPIEFGKDCIEHKQPLSRGGTHARENLDIAHRSCNSRKNNKTEKEYLEGISHAPKA